MEKSHHVNGWWIWSVPPPLHTHTSPPHSQLPPEIESNSVGNTELSEFHLQHHSKQMICLFGSTVQHCLSDTWQKLYRYWTKTTSVTAGYHHSDRECPCLDTNSKLSRKQTNKYMLDSFNYDLYNLHHTLCTREVNVFTWPVTAAVTSCGSVEAGQSNRCRSFFHTLFQFGYLFDSCSKCSCVQHDRQNQKDNLTDPR